MRYTPSIRVGDFEKWVEEELVRIAQSVNELYEGIRDVLYVEPSRPREGMIVIADGVKWNPGSGAGAYEYRGGAWYKL